VPRADFVQGLGQCGYVVTDLGQGLLWFSYEVEFGPRKGETVRLGFQVGEDWPLNPPGGPHISPQILPLNTAGGPHPLGSILPSPFGPEWEYWSRPYPPQPGWASTNRSVMTYMRYIAHLFRTL